MSTTFSDPARNIAQLGLEPGMQVADFGAGAGYLAVAAAQEVGPKGKVYIVDIQQELLTKVTHLANKNHLDRFVYIHADLEKPKGSTLRDRSVDAVVVSNLLFQVANMKAIFEEAHRVLQERGKLLITDWRESYGHMGPLPEQVVPVEVVQQLATESGFTFVREIDAGAYHYGLIFIT